MRHERGRPFDSGLVGKPCKRCGDKLTQHHKIYGGYCGHCNGALKQKPWTHSQWTEGTNYEWVKNG